MNEYFEMASSLETASLELEKAKVLLGITLEDIFTGTERMHLSGYAQGFEYVIEAAINKIIQQYDVVHEISNTLYEVSREVKNA